MRIVYVYIRVKTNYRKERVYLDSINMKEIENIHNNTSEINDLYNKYNLDIRAIVAKILYYSNQERDIDDCVNEVYLKLIENLQQYNETRGSIAAFVAIIARSTALNYCKSNMRKPNELIGDEKIDVLSDPINVEDAIEFKILVENITKKLKKEERVLFTMRYVYYFTPEEIAKEFKINLGTAYKRITRLKNKVKKFLTKEGVIL